MFLNQKDFYYMCGDLCKNLAKFCRKDGIPLRTRISSNEARMVFGGFLLNRKMSESMEIHSLNFRINTVMGMADSFAECESAMLWRADLPPTRSS